MSKKEHQARDEKLIEEFRSGDLSAIETLLSHYKPMVRARAASYFLPGADREDLIQEGMLGLFSAARQYDKSRGPFAAYADLSVTSHLKDAIRRANRRQNEPLNLSVSLDAEDTEWMELSAPSGIVEQEQLDAFRQFMQNDLSPLERSVAHFYLSGYSYDEIAKKTGTKRKSVDNAMTRIRRKLKRAHE